MSLLDLQARALAAATGPAQERAKVALLPLSVRVEIAALVLQGIIASRGSSVGSRNKADDVKHALEYADALLTAAMKEKP